MDLRRSISNPEIGGNLEEDAFVHCSKLGKKVTKDIASILKNIAYDSQVVIIGDSNETSMFLQFSVGDILINIVEDGTLAIDSKAEAGNLYGNFFIESWSNRRTGRLGWFCTSLSDLISYTFEGTQERFFMDLRALRVWGHTVNEEGTERITKFPLKPQNKYVQANDSYGYTVDINTLMKELGPDNIIKFISPLFHNDLVSLYNFLFNVYDRYRILPKGKKDNEKKER